MKLLYISLSIAVFLTFLIITKRKKEKSTKFSFQIFTLLWTCVVCSCLTFILPEMVNDVRTLLIYPKYDAEIVDFNNRYEWTYNHQGNKTRLLKYTPVVKFHPENSSLAIETTPNFSSQKKPEIGNFMRIAYKNGVVYEISIRSWLFLGGLFLASIFLMYPILISLCYIHGKDSSKLKTIAVKSLIYFVFIGVVAIILGIIWKSLQ